MYTMEHVARSYAHARTAYLIYESKYLASYVNYAARAASRHKGRA